MLQFVFGLEQRTPVHLCPADVVADQIRIAADPEASAARHQTERATGEPGCCGVAIIVVEHEPMDAPADPAPDADVSTVHRIEDLRRHLVRRLRRQVPLR
ncbi:hypothetical protein Xph01_48360 [Micromonospora phaseoli]|nr:hypothetical protein Xph01_48360 [Micromonospora phaseoli]